jgi:hypothetical protein
MRHYPAYCTDCRRLWLVATESAPSASPACPRCQESGRLVPGAYYSDPGSVVFNRLEQALYEAQLGLTVLGRMATDIERALPCPTEAGIDEQYGRVMTQLSLPPEPRGVVGKRVTLRMLVTIASTLSQPVVRESGVMRLPQTIPGLFDPVHKKRSKSDAPAAAHGAALEEQLADGELE